MTADPTHTAQADTDAKTYRIERVFAAAPERVFRAWSDCAELRQWWGPRGWELEFCEIDFRPDGTWRYMMQGPDGTESWGKATYREIVAPQRITYLDAFTDANGTVIPNTPEMTIEVDFIDEHGSTRLRSVTHFARAEDLKAVLDMGMEQGIRETWDRLDELVTGA